MSVPVFRLKRRSEFLRAARVGTKWAAPGMVVQHRDRGESDEAAVRVGFTVTRKVGNAVVRNRIKRRLKAAADVVVQADARGGRDLVIIGRKAALRRPFEALLKDLETALKRTGAHRKGRGNAK